MLNKEEEEIKQQIEQTKKNQIEQDEFEVLEILEWTAEEQAQQKINYQNQLKNKLKAEEKYQISYWYKYVEDFTFKTYFIPFKLNEAKLLDKLYYKKDGQTFEWSQQEKQTMQEFKTKVDEVLQKINPCFIKLSSRSPKDTANDLEIEERIKMGVLQCKKKLQQLGFTKEFIEEQKLKKNIQNNEQLLQIIDNDQANDLFKFVINFSRQFLKIRNFDDVIWQLSNSERIITDINEYISLKSEDQANQNDEEEICQLCFREWHDILDEHEFRCFFFNRKLTAITQYDENIFFSEFQNKNILDKIIGNIKNCFDSVSQNLPFENGVADFIATENTSYLLEVNPFQQDDAYCGGSVRGSLFSWKNDKELLMNGPFEYRFLQKPRDNLFEDIIPFYAGPAKRGADQLILKALIEIVNN